MDLKWTPFASASGLGQPWRNLGRQEIASVSRNLVGYLGSQIHLKFNLDIGRSAGAADSVYWAVGCLKTLKIIMTHPTVPHRALHQILVNICESGVICEDCAIEQLQSIAHAHPDFDFGFGFQPWATERQLLLRCAVTARQSKIARYLLTLPGASARNGEESDILNAACRNGDLELVKALVEIGGANPTRDMCRVVRYAKRAGNEVLVSYVLGLPGVKRKK